MNRNAFQVLGYLVEAPDNGFDQHSCAGDDERRAGHVWVRADNWRDARSAVTAIHVISAALSVRIGRFGNATVFASLVSRGEDPH